MKLIARRLRLELHIILREQVPGALEEMGRIIHCCNSLIMKLEGWFRFGSTQQFQGLDIVGTHIIDSGNNLQSSILTGGKNLTQ
jgi:hypothetical protein